MYVPSIAGIIITANSLFKRNQDVRKLQQTTQRKLELTLPYGVSTEVAAPQRFTVSSLSPRRAATHGNRLPVVRCYVIHL